MLRVSCSLHWRTTCQQPGRRSSLYRRELRKGLPEVDATKGRKPSKPGAYKAKTTNKYLGLVLTVLNHAERILKTDFPDKPRPSDKDDDGVPLLEPVQPRSRYLTPEEERRLEEACKDEPDLMDMWKADLQLGLRETNLCEARWENYDKDARLLTVYLKAKGQEDLPHQVYITDEALEILKRREGLHPEFIFTLPCRIANWLDGEFRKKGEHIPVLPALFYSRMKEAWTKAKIKNLIIHDFRRTAARRVYLEKDIYAAKVFLGHRDIETTADYISLGPLELAEARRNMLLNRPKN
ncbi:tyrosine-type recombinase/integrase [Bradyrhizobium arachidis]|uniref:tyrosine-type recombinase/integrase n=1 Tax=Bradyrhizobium arachidis TaxID=858423 RepID=UPI0021635522|nr:tyrosine-type recombinase/integrase [Bradyrhizobium arachidis]UVO30339.1 tyrosine-type recombinase/integrase [Bradyrhizobium arachidis]